MPNSIRLSNKFCKEIMQSNIKTNKNPSELLMTEDEYQELLSEVRVNWPLTDISGGLTQFMGVPIKIQEAA